MQIDGNAANRFFVKFKVMTMNTGYSTQHPHCLRSYFWSNAVASKHGYFHFHKTIA